MRSILSRFPTENLQLKKRNGEAYEVVGLVDGSSDLIASEDQSIPIEEGDVFVRALPSGLREYYRVTDRGFYAGGGSIPNHYQSKVEKMEHDDAMELLAGSRDSKRPRKLFISHSSKDEKCVSALVELLEDIGMPEGSFVCTSVPGYGIPGGKEIYDWLRDQFLSCDLRVLFVLSHNYYESAACLNEMGAAWVTKAADMLLLLPGFGFGDIRGCINPRKIGISFEAGEEELKHRLNEFKDTLIDEYCLPAINQARWERHRNRFIEAVMSSAEHAGDEETRSTVSPLPVVGEWDVGDIPPEPALLLAYAADNGGRILRVRTLGSLAKVLVSGITFADGSSQRWSACWEEALDTLTKWGWVKDVGTGGQVYELTGTGYKKADWLKENMEIDTNRNPMDELKDFE